MVGWMFNGWVYGNSTQEELSSTPITQFDFNRKNICLGALTPREFAPMGMQSQYLLGNLDGVNTSVKWWVHQSQLRDFQLYQLNSSHSLPVMNVEMGLYLLVRLKALAVKHLKYLPGKLKVLPRRNGWQFTYHEMNDVLRHTAIVFPEVFKSKADAVTRMFSLTGVNDEYLAGMYKLIEDEV